MRFFYLLFCITFVSQVSAQSCDPIRYQDRIFDDITVTSDIIYGQANPYDAFGSTALTDLSLDFYEPTGDLLAQRPLVVMCFGGAFLFGTKEDTDIVAWCDSLAHHGYAVAAIEYRTGFNTFSERSAYRAVYRALQDLRAAIRFLEEDPDNQGFRVDPDYIFTGGESAGAITAIHTAFLDTEAERPIETYATTFSIDEGTDMGCLDCSGNTYVQAVNTKGIISMWGAVESLDFITAADQTPIVMVHGDADPIVPYGSGAPFSSPFFPTVHGSGTMTPHLANLGIPHELYTHPGDASHTVYGAPNASFPNAEWDLIFLNSKNFIHNVMSFDSPIPTGATTVEQSGTNIYTVPQNANSDYCWMVTAGTITNNTGNEITVEWDETATMGMVSLIERNSFELQGTAQELAITIVPEGALPIELTAFRGQKEKQGIRLNWTANTNTGLSYFELEKSNDTEEFKAISSIQNPVNSLSFQDFDYLDTEPFLGNNFYRIKQIDTDGKITYSSVINIPFEEVKLRINQLTNNGLVLSWNNSSDENMTVEIYNAAGVSIYEYSRYFSPGNNELRVEIPNLVKGFHVATLTNKQSVSTVKFVW